MRIRRPLCTFIIAAILFIVCGGALKGCPSSSGGSHHSTNRHRAKENPCLVVTDPKDPDTWCYEVHAPGGRFHVKGKRRAQPYIDDPKYHVTKLP